MSSYAITLSRKHSHKPGHLVAIEPDVLGFEIRRVFYISGFTEDINYRGYHGHRNTTQCIICLNGSAVIQAGENIFNLENDTQAVVIPPNNFIVMKMDRSALLLVLCDTIHSDDIVYT